MPTVAWIAGFAVVFYYDDHGEPHFHLRGKGTVAKIMLADLSLSDVKGEVSARDLRIIRVWARQHLPELYRAWTQAREQRPIEQVGD